jgi:cobalt-zinc-cadmium efflux system outer membrane protein
MERWGFVLFGLAFLVGQGSAAAQDGTITLEQALQRARERAPALLAARGRVEEARGGLTGASVLLQKNPVLDLEAGPRWGESGDTTDYEVGLSQEFDLGGRRSARVTSARSGVERELARSQDGARMLSSEVATAFWRGAAARERLRLTGLDEADAGETAAAVERRFELGDVPALQVNAARVAYARSRAARLGADASFATALGDLRLLLGMRAAEPIHPVGELAPQRSYDLSALLARMDERPDLRVLAAELARAEADLRLGRALAWPELTARASYGRDEGDDVARGGLSVELPIFDRGQGVRAKAAARASRLRQQLAARRTAAEVEVRTAFERFLRQAEAASVLERNALPAIADNEVLARKSIAAGELGLVDWLVLRREAIATRLDHVDRQLEAAEAATELEAAAGLLR